MCRLLACIGHSGRRQSVSGRIRAFTRRKRTNVDSRALPGGVERAGGRAHHADQAPRRLSAVVSGGGWETFRHKIAALPMDAHWWRRIFLGNASEVEIDGSNRVLISSELRSAAALD